MKNQYHAHFANFLLPLPQHEYNFIQLHPFTPINSLQNQANNSCKRNSPNSFDGKGKWTFREQKQYLLFISQNMQEMREKSTRKSNKVFLKMSNEVKSRSADQCRSHHQKVLKYHESLQEIIRYYTEEVYSFESIFGSKEVQGKKKALAKTSAQLQNEDSCNIRVERGTFKIILDVQLMSDY